ADVAATKANPQCRSWLGPNQLGITTPEQATPAAHRAHTRHHRTHARHAHRHAAAAPSGPSASPAPAAPKTPDTPKLPPLPNLPDAQNLVRQNEVREGGERIGLVTSLEPVRLANGRIGARLHLKLDRSTPAVPVDSTWAVRPRSALSLKYLELVRGHSRKTIPDGGHVAATQSRN